jgi:hypothetical protein
MTVSLNTNPSINSTPEFNTNRLAGGDKAQETSKEFASYVVTHMVKEFYPKESETFFGSNDGEEFARDLLATEFGKEVAKQNDLGISKSTMKSLIQIQEMKGR